jgi:16S rRNA (cytidine1402-2'-O)-methyltransferase
MPEEKQEGKKRGRLYVVATPIGNLDDITLRALRVLQESFIIACEDTRQTIKILNKFGFKKKLISYFHPQEQKKIPKIIGFLQEGKNVALVSDAGTPGIADPGFPLIKEAIAQGIDVVPVPGPSAITAALSAGGLPTHKFLFLSFPPPKKSAAKKLLLSLKSETATMVFYLPSRKLIDFLALIQETLGGRNVVIARELSKVYEEFMRGKPAELMKASEKKPPRGELTLMVEGKPKKSR